MVTKLHKIVEDKYKFLVCCLQSSIWMKRFSRRKEMKIGWKLYLFFYLCYVSPLYVIFYGKSCDKLQYCNSSERNFP